MDLPVELRLYIAEYVMAGNQSLKWHWPTYTPSTRVGSFKRIDDLTVLSRVSRQLHSETSGLVWKMNAVSFTGSHFGEQYRVVKASRGSESQAVLDAYRYFMRIASGSILQRIKLTALTIDLRAFSIEERSMLEIVAEIAQGLPGMQVQIHDKGWGIRKSLSRLFDIGDPAGVHTYLEYGQDLKNQISPGAADGAHRNWRIYPDLNQEGREIIRSTLKGEALQEALDWETAGI